MCYLKMAKVNAGEIYQILSLFWKVKTPLFRVGLKGKSLGIAFVVHQWVDVQSAIQGAVGANCAYGVRFDGDALD